MARVSDQLFEADVWTPALLKYGAVAQLTTGICDLDGRFIVEPQHPTPLFTLFAERAYDPGLFAECAGRCLAPAKDERATVVTASMAGLAAVGTALVLDGVVVGAAVAGYALVEFSQSPNLQRLAREANIPFQHLWALARRLQPMSQRRLVLQGELLQVLGDTILRENQRTRQYDETARELVAAGAAKDEFLAVLSHELRTPLTPILGWVHLLRRQGVSEQVTRAIEVIERNVLLQVRLVDDLLELTRVTRGKVTLDLRACDVCDAVRSALESIGDSAKQKGIAVKLAVPEMPPLLIEADPDRLQQVFRNVFSNAVKFTPEGGTVSIDCSGDDGEAVVAIRDTGEGIAADFLPFVFDMFRQQEQGTRRLHQGLGIGLALVKRLTELQGGSVTVASKGEGSGTAVVLTFPLMRDRRQLEREPASAVDSPQTLGALAILVVEDVEDSRDAMRLLLQLLGARVSVASDGVEALAAVDRHRPDVVLCDLRMPRMDGFEFIREVHAMPAHADLPVIAISGFVGSADRKRSHAAGFAGHVAKPFEVTALTTAVGDAVARRRA